MLIHADAVVSCYIDAASFLMVLLILVLSDYGAVRRRLSQRIFYGICVCLEILCALFFFCHAMYGQTAMWCHTGVIVGRTVLEITMQSICALWVAYIHRKVHVEEKRMSWPYLASLVPLAVFSVLFVLNAFNGMIFTYSENNQFQPRTLFYVITGIELGYFFATGIVVQIYDRKTTKIRFLRITPLVLSISGDVIAQNLVPYDLGALGLVIGMSLLYLSIANENHFVDHESGLYNNRYVAYLFDLAVAGKNETHSVLLIEMDGNLQAGFSILRHTLHRTGDVARVEEKKFLMFSKERSRSTLQYVSSMMDEAVEKYNAEHPDAKVQIAARCRMRTEEEDAFSFLRTVLQDKESGDEMRGIVSMISELDRLDKELKLASDIQENMLPVNFPAFPDRHEFDLYASMTPAKEVGGDFYDFFLIDSDHLGMVIADVSGKGIPAALFMMVSKTLIKNQLMSGCDPATALERVNLQLCERNTSMMFVTVWLAVLEISTGHGVACNAGHENPGVRRAGGNFELLKYKHSIFIGVSRKAKYENREFEMHPGDSVFVYTDGVPEAVNAATEMFGEKRLEDTLNEDADAAPEVLIQRMRAAVDRFADAAPQFDDITMLCMKYYGTESERGTEEE